ncbi:cyclopropane-fatty-acyl-phospholipid synthase family protein [Patulibacter brassicae]|uniref:Cyclopropane-fatty-acyl-phospholipid synthase family protein n=1 Tax=Patulibacter brassicae TaxID=1705717 RepID=A0ABU4VJ66_9ACTN|nr:cyclopropane-fatty-acyl-phospholipid synthase family protein [Patulibacter brassicae]MDX8150860.1 cyclopropane-fatty-acyl-phospholipid synthase family protein [Patulibacter brassicae]
MTAPTRRSTLAARGVALRLLRQARHGRLRVIEADGTVHRFGTDPEPGSGLAPLEAELRLHDAEVWPSLLRGSLGLGESYGDGRWSSPDLVALVSLGARNMPAFDRLRERLAPLLVPAQRVRHGARNTIARSRRQIRAHYDLSNDFFGLFLDPTMLYSCALFDRPGATLEEAQVAKLDQLCRKLDLAPGVRLLEIGTGWGALAIHAAREYGAHVTTTTISERQHELAAQRIAEAGLQDRIDLRLEDYRDLQGRYDRIVSVEMIEAVGWRDLPTFFRRCDELLAPDGLLALQAITIDDRAYEAEKRGRSFINTLIFPGGCLPSQAEMARCTKQVTSLRTVGVEDLSPHYAETLRRWRAAFHDAHDAVRGLGYDERFVRLWDLYLAYCQAGFAERRIQLVQQVYAGPARREERSPLGESVAPLERAPA